MRSIAFGAQFVMNNLNMADARRLATKYEDISKSKVFVGANGLGQPVLQTGDHAIMVEAASRLGLPNVNWNAIG